MWRLVEMGKERIYITLLYCVFFSFALALSNNQIISEVFVSLRWVVLIFFLFFGLYLKKWKLDRKNINLSVFVYFFYLCILSVSTFSFSGLNFNSIIWLSPFYLALLIPVLVILSKEDLVDHYIKFSLLFLVTIIPFLLLSSSYPGGRFAGWMQNTNMLAGYTCIAFSFIFLKYIFGERKRIYIFSLLILFIIILLTQSRGALFSVLITIFIGLMLNIKYKKNIIIMFFLSLLGFVFYTNLTIKEAGSDDVQGLLTVRKVEVGSREEKIERQLDSFWYSPIYGVGAVADEKNDKSRYQAESSYTEILSMVGVIGFSIFLLLIILNFLRKDNKKLYLVPILIISLSEGYLTGIGSIISMLAYIFLLKD